MKIAVVFLLVAVTASYGLVHQSKGGSSSECHNSNSHPGHGYGTIPNTNCLQKILKTDLKKVLHAVKVLVCSYETCKEKGKKGTNDQCSLEEWADLLKNVTMLLKDLGCSVDQLLLGGKETVEKITEKVGEALECLHVPIRKLLVHIKLEEPVFNMLCKLLGDALEKVAAIFDGLDDVLSLAGPVKNLLGGGVGGLMIL